MFINFIKPYVLVPRLLSDLILCLEKCEEENKNVNIPKPRFIIPAKQINKSCQFDHRFKVIKQSPHEVNLIAKAKCGSFNWNADFRFPLPITQDQQQPVQPNIQIGNVTGSTILAGSTVTNSAVACSDTNIQRNKSSNQTTNVTGSTIVSGVNQTNFALLSSDVNQQQNSSQKNVKN
uniref:uncharacterized protein LOC108950819 n=1 Tax=Ciona intestinalis TaxID=7719 RepID=UPI00089DBB29|nr:uncharacterized protein LOC108950819 [Ciona intestinalis]|eukprot:XP_018672459.1 uncharacterized protein LOC108950819 [Ciona intestinalis]